MIKIQLPELHLSQYENTVLHENYKTFILLENILFQRRYISEEKLKEINDNLLNTVINSGIRDTKLSLIYPENIAKKLLFELENNPNKSVRLFLKEIGVLLIESDIELSLI